MGLFDRDTDMSDDDEPSTDEPRFEPVEGTAPTDGNEDEGSSDDGSGDAGSPSPAAKLARVRFRDDDFNGTLKRAVDEEAGVVLYAYGNGNAGGLAAVPIDQTRLGGD